MIEGSRSEEDFTKSLAETPHSAAEGGEEIDIPKWNLGYRKIKVLEFVIYINISLKIWKFPDFIVVNYGTNNAHLSS